METNEKKGRKPTPPDATEVNAEPKTGPLGRTRSEEQRRRLIITGLATPGLMTLPSRRVWASKCTKSKLLSGNLSPTGKKPDCPPMGCSTQDWKDMRAFDGGNWTGWSFNEKIHPSGYQVFPDDFTLLDALEKRAEPGENVPHPPPKLHDKGKLKDIAKEAAAAWLNWYYIAWPRPNNIYNFQLSEEEVRTKWAQAVEASIAKLGSLLDEIKNQLKAANEDGTICPFR